MSAITETTLTQIQDFIVKHVKADADYDVLCNTIAGSSLNYARGSDLSRDTEKTPFFTSYKFNSQKTDGEDPYWVVQYVIGIDGEGEEPVTEDGVKVWQSTDNVEQLAVKALDLIHEGLRDGSFLGQCLLRITDENILITEVGEAFDVQAIVTLRLEDYSTFN